MRFTLSSSLYKNDRLLLDTFVGWAKVSIVLISYILNLKINENKYIGSLTNIIYNKSSDFGKGGYSHAHNGYEL